MPPTSSPVIASAAGAASPVVDYLLDPWGTIGRLFGALAGWVAAWPWWVWLGFGGGLVAAVLGRRAVAEWQARQVGQAARWVVVLPPPAVEPATAEVLWANLAGLLRPRGRVRPHVAWEYVWTDEGLAIGLWVPGMVPAQLVERAVEAACPGARVRPESLPDPLAGAGVLAGELRLAGGDGLGLRIEHHADPLRAILGAAADLGAEEATWVQVLARPASRAGRTQRLARSSARVLGAGGGGGSPIGRVLDLLTAGVAQRVARRQVPTLKDLTRGVDARTILAKLTEPAWEVTLRYAVATRDPDPVPGRLAARAQALSAAFGLYAGRNQLTPHPLREPEHTLPARRFPRGGDLLSQAELGALAHLPLDLTVPGLERAGARPVAPPPQAPQAGKILGDAEVGPRRPIATTPADACYHVHLLGATGSGKSTLITNLALDDIHAGRGVVVVDPKGDLVTDILDRLPAQAADRLVLLDPEEAAPPTMNVLEGPDPDLAVDHLVGILQRIWSAHWGPRIDDVMRASCLTLLRRPGSTLADVPRLLGDPAFRQPYLAGLNDPVGLGGFWAWYEAQSPAAQNQIIGPIMTRLRAFLMRRFVRSVVGSASSSFDLGQVLDGGICLARLPKGQLGDETSRLLGSMLVSKVWQAATARAARAQPSRNPCVLYVDECQNFLNLPYRFEELLPEARGYGLSLMLAHQHLGQLSRELYEALGANARTKIFFNLSPTDARLLEAHTLPQLTAHDLANLGAYQAAVRLLTSGVELPACTAQTRPAPLAIPDRAAYARAIARHNHGRSPGQRYAEQLTRDLALGGPDHRLPGPFPVPPPAGSPPGGDNTAPPQP